MNQLAAAEALVPIMNVEPTRKVRTPTTISVRAQMRDRRAYPQSFSSVTIGEASAWRADAPDPAGGRARAPRAGCVV